MPEIKSRADSLRLYLTGASAVGAEQLDPDASLGGNISSTLENFFTYSLSDPFSNITIDFISGAHDEGSGLLIAVTADSLSWQPPGGVEGNPVTIANGESKIVEAQNSPGTFIRLSRTSADDLSGTCTVHLSYKYNNVLGFDNVSSGDAASGITEYRALILKNESANTVKNVKLHIPTLVEVSLNSGSSHLPVSGIGSLGIASGNFNNWPESGFCRIVAGSVLREIVYYDSRTSSTLIIPETGRGMVGTSAQEGALTDFLFSVSGLRVASEAVVSDAIQAIANESTAPTGLTFSSGISVADCIDLNDINPGELRGIWLERFVSPTSQSEARVRHGLFWTFDAT